MTRSQQLVATTWLITAVSILLLFLILVESPDVAAWGRVLWIEALNALVWLLPIARSAGTLTGNDSREGALPAGIATTTTYSCVSLALLVINWVAPSMFPNRWHIAAQVVLLTAVILLHIGLVAAATAAVHSGIDGVPPQTALAIRRAEAHLRSLNAPSLGNLTRRDLAQIEELLRRLRLTLTGAMAHPSLVTRGQSPVALVEKVDDLCSTLLALQVDAPDLEPEIASVLLSLREMVEVIAGLSASAVRKS